jgi:hypothetical protein
MTSLSDRIEVITSVQRRRRWSASEKVRMVEEAGYAGAVGRLRGSEEPPGDNATAKTLKALPVHKSVLAIHP